MPDHTAETRLALIEERLNDLRKSVDLMAQRMVTHADLANATISRTQFDVLERRVSDLERVSVSTLWATLTKVAAGLLSVYAVADLLTKAIK